MLYSALKMAALHGKVSVMTDNAPERIWANPDRWIDRPPSPHCFRSFEYVEYVCADLYTAVCAERDALDETCITWAEVSQRNYQRAKAAEAERDALSAQLDKKYDDIGEMYIQRAELEAERDALKARVDAAEAALELESEWAVIQPNTDLIQNPRVKAVVDAAEGAAKLRAALEALRALEQGDS